MPIAGGRPFHEDAAAATVAGERVVGEREVVVEARGARLRAALAVIVVAGGEHGGEHAVEHAQGALCGAPLRCRVLIAEATAPAHGDVVLLHEVAFVHHQPDVPRRAVIVHPLRHPIEVRLVLRVLGVVLGVGKQRDGPAGARAARRVHERRGRRLRERAPAAHERRGQYALQQTAAGQHEGGLGVGGRGRPLIRPGSSTPS